MLWQSGWSAATWDVVATMGTRATGSWIRLRDFALRAKHGFRITRMRYGGYFVLAEILGRDRAISCAVGEADSIVIDPHKHGFATIRCGCVPFATPKSAIVQT